MEIMIKGDSYMHYEFINVLIFNGTIIFHINCRFPFAVYYT